MKWLYGSLTGLVLALLLAGCGGGGGSSEETETEETTTTFSIMNSYLQHRSFEDPANDGNFCWVSVADEDMAVEVTDMLGMSLFDSNGAEQAATENSLLIFSYYYYDCSSGTCSEPVERTESGYLKRYNSLAADTFLVNVDTPDEVGLESNFDFPGEVKIPVIESSSMTSHWVNDTLVLAWTNPTSDANWADVDQLRVVLNASGRAALYVHVDPTAETVTIPADVVTQATSTGNDTLTSWTVQTRAYDDNDMNYARGYSNRADILYNGFAHIQYGNYEDSANSGPMSYIAVNKGSAPALEANLTGLTVYDSSAAEVLTSFNSFGAYNFLVYDCSSGTCEDPRQVFDSGYFSRYTTLSADTYTLSVVADDGSSANTVVEYDPLTLPFISSSTITWSYVGGDLQINWSNPVSDPNWSEVDQIRVPIYDGDYKLVLYVKIDPTVESITIPQNVLNQAAAFGDGTPTRFRLQTRAYDSNGINNARGHSLPVDLI